MESYLALGSNLGRRRDNLAGAVEGLCAEGIGLQAISSVWETEPVGGPAQPWFLNLVLKCVSDLGPFALLDLAQALEARGGRRSAERNGPRSIDVDLLIVGRLQIRDPRLELPHPRMWQRRFVLQPLFEIAPRLKNPASGRTVGEELERLVDPSRVRNAGSLSARLRYLASA